MVEETLKEKARRVAARFMRSRKIWDMAGARHIRNVDAYMWRNRFQLMAVSARGIMATNTVPEVVGPNLDKWRGMSPQSGNVIRTVLDHSIAQRRPFTVSEIEVALPGNFSLSRKSLHNVIKRGVELELLTPGCNSTYEVTELLVDEFFARTTYRDLQPDLIEWARQIVMIADMREVATRTTELEERGSIHDSGRRTLIEEIDNGLHDDEIGFDRTKKN